MTGTEATWANGTLKAMVGQTADYRVIDAPSSR